MGESDLMGSNIDCGGFLYRGWLLLIEQYLYALTGLSPGRCLDSPNLCS